ncbi:MAG: DNA/RNA nuclease SfsA [Candidatus Puniceispirillales bacterium]
MKLPPLTQGILIKRYKRFLADVDFGGRIETVHCPNPGAMTGLKDEGMTVWCSTSDNPARKLKKTLEVVEADGGLVGINTNLPNRLAAEALAAGLIPRFRDYPVITPEFTYTKGTRFDFRLSHDDGRDPLYLEVKNVHLRRDDGPNPGASEFPDSVTARGAKHLSQLAEIAASGGRAAMLYVIQRSDGDRFALAADIDPVYANAFRAAAAAGVMMEAWQCRVTTEEIALVKPLPVADLVKDR